MSSQSYTYWQYIQSPIGNLRICADDGHILAVEFGSKGQYSNSTPLTEKCAIQLDAYFNNELEEFDLPLDPQGTAFQKKIWDSLLAISYGTCTSYGEIAKQLGDPGASRAVGTANGANPIPIIIPCHRVIGQSGKLVGYAGGLKIKKWLLEHEGYYKQLDLFGRRPING